MVSNEWKEDVWMKNFWNDSASSMRERKKEDDRVVLENSYGKVAFKENDEKLAVEISRKNEFQEETFENSREQLQDGHTHIVDTTHGQLTVDSHKKNNSAVVYEENLTTSAEKIYEHLQGLKKEVNNETIAEMIPEKESIQKKIFQELKFAKEEMVKEKLILEAWDRFSEEKEHLSDDGIDEDEESNQNGKSNNKG